MRVYLLLVVCLSLLPTLAAAPKPDGVRHEPHEMRQEGDRLLRSLKDIARIWYTGLDRPPTSLKGDCKLGELELTSMYFKARDAISQDQQGLKGAIACDHRKDKLAGYGLCIFVWATGEDEVHWFDTIEEFDKSHEEFKATSEEKQRAEIGPERAKIEGEFREAVHAKALVIESSKAWDFFFEAVLEFNDLRDSYLALCDDAELPVETRELAAAKAITLWFKARYGAELLCNRFDKDGVSRSFEPVDLKSADISALTDEELGNDAIRSYQAAWIKVAPFRAAAESFLFKDVKYDLYASRVFESQEWATAQFGDWQKKFQAAVRDRQFAQEDLKFVNSPDYQSGEKKRWEKYREDHPADKSSD